jgi:hypothetical protein
MTRVRVPAGVTPTLALLRGAVARTSWPRKIGQVKTRWRPGLVLCDFDGPAVPVYRVAALARLLALRVEWARYDRTARGWHVVIKVRQRLTLIETVAVQAILGSDPYREAFNFARARTRPAPYWAARANLLFERKVSDEISTDKHGPRSRAATKGSRRDGNRRTARGRRRVTGRRQRLGAR